jgi:hypothetical protein
MQIHDQDYELTVPELRQADAEAPGCARVEQRDLASVVRADPVAIAEGDPAMR